MASHVVRRVFWENPYQRKLVARVAQVVGDQVSFDETIIYTFNGGQESDKATLNGHIPVLDSCKDGSSGILYRLPPGHGLLVGDQVVQELDWARRSRLMRLHFACELVLVIVNRLFGKKAGGQELGAEEIDRIGPRKTGAHIAEASARVDFYMEGWGKLADVLPQVQEEFHRVVDANLPIEKGWLDRETGTRYWRVDGLAQVPCGGTHCDRTGEIGHVVLKRERAGQGSERVRICLAEPAALPPRD